MQKDDKTYYYHQDRLGSITAITDAAGRLIETYQYTAFGQPTIYDGRGNQIEESQISNPYYFTGRRLDPETNLYYYRNRYYSPLFGRFITRDPAGIINGPNLYAYVGNNPVNFTDPWGLLNIIGGGGGSFIANRDPQAPGNEWRSNEAAGGLIVNPGFGKSYADFGIFSFAGRGGGFNIGTDAFIGFLRGQNIEGHAVNLNFVAGPVQVSVVLGEEGKGFQGIIIGLGPAVPAGFSATESITESFTVKKLLNKLFNDKDKKNDYKK